MPRKGSKQFHRNPIQLHIWGSSHTATNHFLPAALEAEMSDPHFKKFSPPEFHAKSGGIMSQEVVSDMTKLMTQLTPNPQCHAIFYGLFQKLVFLCFAENNSWSRRLSTFGWITSTGNGIAFNIMETKLFICSLF